MWVQVGSKIWMIWTAVADDNTTYVSGDNIVMKSLKD